MDKLEELTLQVSPEASTRGVSSEKQFLEISKKFTGKYLCQSLVSIIKQEALAQVFSCGFFEISKSIFFTEHLLATASLCHLILLVRFFQGLKYAYVVHIVVFLDLIRFVCFYGLMNRGLFRTLSNIHVGAYEKIVNY